MEISDAAEDFAHLFLEEIYPKALSQTAIANYLKILVCSDGHARLATKDVFKHLPQSDDQT